VDEDLLGGVILGRDDSPALGRVEELDHAGDSAELLEAQGARGEAQG